MEASEIAEVIEKFPDVLVDQDNIVHFQELLRKKLVMNVCLDCGYWIYPHRPACPKCWSVNVAPREVSGRGKIYMFTYSYEGHQNARVSGIEPPARTCWAAIELVEREGLRYLAPVVGCAEDNVRVGMPVRLDWTTIAGVPRPVFQPEERDLVASEQAQ